MLPGVRLPGGERIGATAAAAIVVLLSASYFVAGRAAIAAALAQPGGRARFAADDSEHYVAIAERLAAGDWSFSDVAPNGGSDLAHRQPLYPMLLAASMAMGANDVEHLASVNLVLVVASLWVAYGIGARVYASRLAGVVAAATLWHIPFLFENATTRLLTEPGYVLCSLLAAWAFLAGVAAPGSRCPVFLACAAALAYLQRVNGLVLAACALPMLFVLEATAWPKGTTRRALAFRWGVALLLCVTVAAPSWMPRLRYAHDPFYHGYLSNYLWVDDHRSAHVPGPPRYSWRDYVRTHDAEAALSRSSYGLRRALWEAPREKYGDTIALAMLVGSLLAVAAGDRATVAWLGVGVLQMLPLAWSALANPARRIPATALLAFGLVGIVAGAAIIAKHARRGS